MGDNCVSHNRRMWCLISLSARAISAMNQAKRSLSWSSKLTSAGNSLASASIKLNNNRFDSGLPSAAIALIHSFLICFSLSPSEPAISRRKVSASSHRLPPTAVTISRNSWTGNFVSEITCRILANPMEGSSTNGSKQRQFFNNRSVLIVP